MLILVLLGMYFDAAVVFVTKSSLLFRLAVAILCAVSWLEKQKIGIFYCKRGRLYVVDTMKDSKCLMLTSCSKL